MVSTAGAWCNTLHDSSSCAAHIQPGSNHLQELWQALVDLGSDGASSCLTLLAGFPDRHHIMSVHFVERHSPDLLSHLRMVSPSPPCGLAAVALALAGLRQAMLPCCDLEAAQRKDLAPQALHNSLTCGCPVHAEQLAQSACT